jgi:hypothetical protein
LAKRFGGTTDWKYTTRQRREFSACDQFHEFAEQLFCMRRAFKKKLVGVDAEIA